MGFIDKLKSFFSSPEPRIYSRDEVLKEQKKKIVNENKKKETVKYEPPNYNYKTAKEKAKEPISLEERSWVLRFQNQECPYCHYIFEQIKGNRKCPDCKNKVIVRTHYQTKEKCILTEEELELFEKKKQYYYDTRWCIRECSSYDISEKEFNKQWDKMGKAFSAFDVMWYFMNKIRIEYANQGNWGLYRNTFVMQAQNLERRGKSDEAYTAYLYLAYLDANGPSNSAGFGGKPFDTAFSFQAPHTMKMLDHYQEKYDISVEKLKGDFLKEAKNDSLKSMMTLLPEQSWDSFHKEYKKYKKEVEELKQGKELG